MMNKISVLAILVSIFAIGCSDSSSSNKYNEMNPFDVDSNWDISHVTLSCQDSSKCPENHGLLLMRLSSTSVFRCTGFLISSTKVLTAGHCVKNFNSQSQGYFKTPSKFGRSSQVVKIKSVTKIDYDPNDKFKAEHAVIELASPVSVTEYAKPYKGILSHDDEYSAIGVNASSTTDFSIEVSRCKISNQNLYLPADLSTEPTQFTLTKCKIYTGNSGGAIAHKKDYNSIVGVIQTSTNGSKGDYSGSSEAKNIADMSGSANARCFDIPEWNPSPLKCRYIDMKARQTIVDEYIERTFIDEVVAQIKKHSRWSLAADKKTKIFVTLIPFVGTSIIDKNQTEIHYVPGPLCIEKRSAGKSSMSATSLPFRSNFTATDEPMFLPSRSGGSPLEWTFNWDSNGRGSGKLQFMEPFVTFEKSSKELLKIFTNGQKDEEMFCKGNDLEEHIALIKKYLKN